ncbi:hypothetical protein B0H14DRAFT_2844699 [Mycena olivaceomarginata]|nr:hypothetical protein B0H14DRAFT_2844699 [Mycena olivaceomarginata]
MRFSLLFFLSWTLCFSLLFSSFVDGHLLPRNARIALAELPLPSLPSNLRPQATDFSEFDLEAALPPASNTLLQMPVLPTNCAEYVGGPECLSSMTATAVTYEDCGDAFTVCRCDNANMTLDTAVDRLGRVPVGLRRFVGTVFVLENNATRAYTNLSTGDIHLFGDCAMDTWIHEASHTFDFAFFPSFAIADDSCVPDSYSLRNQVEDFAQMSVLKIYMLLHSGHLPPGFESACLSHQLDFMGTLPLYNAQNLFGNTCAINDGSFGARHSKPSVVLDEGRVFMTVPLDPTPSPTATNSACRLKYEEWTLWGAFLFLIFGL